MLRLALIVLSLALAVPAALARDRAAALVQGGPPVTREQALDLAALPAVSRHLVALESVVAGVAARQHDDEPEPALQVGHGFRIHGGGHVPLTVLNWVADGAARRATIAVESAHGTHFRLAIDLLTLPEGSSLRLLDALGETVLHELEPEAIATQLAEGDGPYWTPTIPGRGMMLMIELPAGAAPGPQYAVRLPMVSAMENPDQAIDGMLRFTGSLCVRHSAQCFAVDAGAELARRATFALLVTRSSGATSLCTGVLVNSARQRPYFLTNRHCVANRAEASSVEAVFDYESAQCRIENDNRRIFGTRAYGATLLVSGPGNPAFAGPGDFAFLRLSRFPATMVGLAGYRLQVDSNAPALNYNHALAYPKLGMRARVRALLTDGDVRYELVEGYEYAGSSGSGFFQGPGQLIGLLAYGPNASDCSAGPVGGPGFASIYPRIREFLEQPPAPPMFSYTAMVEFHNSVRDSFFYAMADSGEAVALASGQAGAEWGETGQRFDVLSDAERTPLPICRFRGLATGRHVYLPDGALCRDRRSDPAWVYEGIVLMAEPVYTENGQQCPGNTPLFRLFNGDPGAPNFRYTPHQSVVDAMVSTGWQFAGAVGCAR